MVRPSIPSIAPKSTSSFSVTPAVFSKRPRWILRSTGTASTPNIRTSRTSRSRQRPMCASSRPLAARAYARVRTRRRDHEGDGILMRHRLGVWQGLTIALLFIGYAGYYLCRSDFSVSLPLIIDELASHGMSPAQAKIRLGAITSIAVLTYAIGKFFLAGIADFLGGKRNFLIGMGGSILFTILFSLGGGLPVFTLAWIGNRLVQ